MKRIKLLLAGSHAATPAYATVQEIKKRGINWETHFIGKRWATEYKKSETLEYRELPRLGVIFHSLESGKIQTKFTRHTLPALLKIPFGFVQAFFLISKIKPDLVLSFGGASGAQVCLWSWLLGIPVVVHEQTTAAGRANIFSSRFAKKILLSRKSSEAFFPKSKTVLTGNPLTSEIIEASKLSPRENVKTIFITGGSRGSVWLNEAVESIFPKFLDKYEVIHQVGEGNVCRHKAIGQLSIKKMAEALGAADIVISRAGANTVSEIMALRKPSILIPIPWSYQNEQGRNAKMAEEYGVARILPQNKLSPENLKMEIENLIRDYPKIIKNVASKVSPDLDASKKVVDILEKYIR